MAFLLFSCGPTEEELRQRKEELKRKAIEKELREERIRKEKERLLKVELKRAANYTKYRNQLLGNIKKRRFSAALMALDSSFYFAQPQSKDSLLELKSSLLYKGKRYEEAIVLNTELIDKNPSMYYFERAKCYNKLGKKQEAVNDLNKAIELKHPEAEKLHDQINPIRKKIAYYVTRCCDGSTSNSKGRGTCSHHGGVCNWNDPVYQEYRKY